MNVQGRCERQVESGNVCPTHPDDQDVGYSLVLS